MSTFLSKLSISGSDRTLSSVISGSFPFDELFEPLAESVPVILLFLDVVIGLLPESILLNFTRLLFDILLEKWKVLESERFSESEKSFGRWKDFGKWKDFLCWDNENIPLNM